LNATDSGAVQSGRGRWAALAIAALGVLVLVMAFAVSTGEVSVPFAVIAKTLGNKIFGATYVLDPIQAGIIWNYRLSRTVVAACAGTALALSGAVLQALLRNPLAEPYVLGISAGASTGAVAIVILGFGGGLLSLSGGAFVGALGAFGLVALLASGSGGGSDRVVLAGIAGSQLFNALTAYIVTTSANAEQARGVMFWLLGSLSGANWADVALAAPVALIGSLLCLLHGRALDAFAFGSDAAASLGIAVTRVRVVLFALTAAMTAVMVSLVGSIGFVGLVVPHAMRLVVGPTHSRLLPASAMAGAVFMVLADIVSRIIVPQQVVPIGVVTALVGAPAFAVLLTRAHRHERGRTA
jgi:iron complex transport system permease protein